MFVIIFYDVESKRCNKMLKTCRKYLQWIQNSVLEGEISAATFERMITDIKKIIRSTDSVVVYKFKQMKYYDRLVYGVDKKKDIKFI